MPSLLEEELEEYIFDNEKALKKIIGNFKSKNLLLFRQFNLGIWGIVDLISFEFIKTKNKSFYKINIIELKKDRYGYDALGQALRYKRGLETIIDKCCNIIFDYKIQVHV